MSANTEISPLHIQQGMAFTCHNEGVCCRVFENIPVDDNAGRALETMDESLLRERAGVDASTPLTVASAAGTTSEQMARKECGACVMMTPDNLCAIHAIAGPDAKPQPCQDFPFRYTETPGGVYVGLSFVCPTVRRNAGRLLVEQSDELNRGYQRAASRRDVAAEIALNPRLTVSWDEYLQLEQALLELLSMDDVTLPDRIIALCMLPGFIDQVQTQADTGAAPPIGEIIAAMRRGGYQHILKVAGKQTRPNLRSRRMFLGMYTSFANTLHRRGRQGRIATVVGVMNQYVHHTFGQGHVTLKPLPARLSNDELDSATLPDSGPVADAITRYLAHCIFRKDLLLSGDVTRRIRLLALNAALIPWYALAAAEAEDAAVSPKHWDEAVGHVERLYGFHSTFHRFFESNKTFADIVDSFILKPTYPFTLFR